jgi:archaellum component FlaG (FlaF/FlaG flagellin family)
MKKQNNTSQKSMDEMVKEMLEKAEQQEQGSAQTAFPIIKNPKQQEQESAQTAFLIIKNPKQQEQRNAQTARLMIEDRKQQEQGANVATNIIRARLESKNNSPQR